MKQEKSARNVVSPKTTLVVERRTGAGVVRYDGNHNLYESNRVFNTSTKKRFDRIRPAPYD